MYRFQNYNKSSPATRTLDGVVFDSQMEMKRYIELKHLQTLGEISNLRTQVKFELQPSFMNSNGEHIRAISYIADFVYDYKGKAWCEDVKSKMTYKQPDYILKKKMFQYKYKDYIFFENVR